ncbi:MAG: TonB-dependent receptor plug domain-containing protein [Bacteroidia bacterium]
MFKDISLFISLLAISASTALRGQTNPCRDSLFVVITDESNIPIEGVEVFIESKHFLTNTDINGKALIAPICYGMYEVDIAFNDVHLHRRLRTNSNDTIVLKNNILQIGETVIISRTQNDYSLHYGNSPLIPIENKSISEQLSRLPEIRIESTGHSIQKPMLQGMSGIRLPLFQNGFRLETQAWGSDHAPELGRWGVQQIEIYKGAKALTWGANNWGNALNINYTPYLHAFENSVQSQIEYGSNGNSIGGGLSLNHGGRNNYSGIFLHASHHQSGDYQIPSGFLPNTAFQESRIHLGYQQLILKKYQLQLEASAFQFDAGIYTGSHIGNTTDLLNAINSPTPLLLASKGSRDIRNPRQSSEHFWLGAHWRPINGQGWNISINWQRNQRKEFDPHRNRQLTFPQLNIWKNVTQLWIRNIQQFQKVNLEWGVQSQYRWQDYGGFYFIPMMMEWGNAAFLYIKGNQKSPSKWRHAATFRADQFNQTFWIPREFPLNQISNGISGGVSGERHIKHHQLSYHLSYNWRPASASERFSQGVHHGSASYEEGDPLLQWEQGVKTEIQWQKDWPHLKTQMSAFSLYSPNFIHLNPQKQPILSVRGAFPYYRYEAISTTYWGTHIGAEWSYGNWKFKHAVDFIYGIWLNQQTYPTQIPPLRWENHIRYTWGLWSFQLLGTYTHRQFLYSQMLDLAPPPPSYFLIHARINYQPKYAKDLSINLAIDNLFNTEYRDYLDRFRYFTPQAGRNIRIQLRYNLHHHRKHKHIKN